MALLASDELEPVQGRENGQCLVQVQSLGFRDKAVPDFELANDGVFFDVVHFMSMWRWFVGSNLYECGPLWTPVDLSKTVD
jgi:hypothetical protein